MNQRKKIDFILGNIDHIYIKNFSLKGYNICDSIHILVSEADKNNVEEAFLSEGFRRREIFLDKTSLYGFIKPICYELNDVKITVNFKIGFPSQVGNAILPITKDVEDFAIISAINNNNELSECFELAILISSIVYDPSELNCLYKKRILILKSKVFYDELQSVLAWIFYSFSHKICKMLESFSENDCPSIFHEEYLKFSEY